MDKKLYELLRHTNNRETAAEIYLGLAKIFEENYPEMARFFRGMAQAVKANDAVAMLQVNRRLKTHLEQRQGK